MPTQVRVYKKYTTLKGVIFWRQHTNMAIIRASTVVLSMLARPAAPTEQRILRERASCESVVLIPVPEEMTQKKGQWQYPLR